MIDFEWWLGTALIFSIGATVYVALIAGSEAAKAVGYVASIVMLLASIVAIEAGWIE